MGTAEAGGGELAELAGKVAARDRAAGDRVRGAVAAFRAPIRVQTAGRAGVGRSTVAAALTASAILGAVVEESDPVDVPGAPDPTLDADVVVYVLVETVRDADRDAVRTLDPAHSTNRTRWASRGRRPTRGRRRSRVPPSARTRVAFLLCP